jgi:putative MATE family efflux protein
MRDLTRGSVRGHILQLSSFIALTTLFQTLYFLVDLYFVGRLGKEAVAGVGLAGNLMMIVLALTQALGVGATSLLAQTMGRRDREQAEVMFNQALVLSVLTGAAYGLVMFALRGPYSRWLAADADTAAQSITFLRWFIPAMSLQFVTVTLGAALRAIGDLKIPTVLSVGTVLLNTGLTPLLIFGVGTGRPLGVAGASLASFIAVGIGCAAFVLYFRRRASPFRFRPAAWRPQPELWWRMLRVGLPVGGEFLLMSVYMMLVYDIIRPFGAAAQAGFGIGIRVMQALFLPSVAIGFATAPVAAQNFGAKLGSRVRESFYSAAAMSMVVMLALTGVCQLAPEAVVRFFNGDAGVVGFGAEYLRIISWGFAASGLVYVTSSVFQGMGHTLPALASSALRLVLFAVPAYAISHRPGFQPRTLWYVALATVFIQVAASVWLLHREFARKLNFGPAPSEA